MCDKVEVITTFKIDRQELPSVTTVMDRFSLMFAARGMATKAWQEHAAYNPKWHWPSMLLLLDELGDTDVLHLENNMSRSFATRHDDTRYILTVTLRDYKEEQPKKKGNTMAWLKEWLFGKETIRRQPKDIHDRVGMTDLEKPKYEPTYQRAYFEKLVAEWQDVHGGLNQVDADIDAKLVIIGDSGYLLRGAAAAVPDTVLWAFLTDMWENCVFLISTNAGLGGKTLGYSVKLVRARGEDGIYTEPSIPVSAFAPIDNRLTKQELLPHFGGHKEKVSTIDLDCTVGPVLMDRLGKLFSLGEVLRLNERGDSCVNVIKTLDYEVVGGPQANPGHIFTRLSKAK